MSRAKRYECLPRVWTNKELGGRIRGMQSLEIPELGPRVPVGFRDKVMSPVLSGELVETTPPEQVSTASLESSASTQFGVFVCPLLGEIDPLPLPQQESTAINLEK